MDKNINQASALELERYGVLDKSKAENVVKYRAHHGRFHDWEEVSRVPGVKKESVDRLKGEGYEIK